MVKEAGTNALKDSGLNYLDDVDVVVASYCYGEPTSGKISILFCIPIFYIYFLRS